MRFLRGLKFLAFFIVFLAVFGWVTERLWNWLMPPIFHLHVITYWQAVGLLLLSKILLGGFHRHGRHCRCRDRRWKEKLRWKRRMKERWHSMTPEERERFRAAMKERWREHGRHRHWDGWEGRGPMDFERRHSHNNEQPGPNEGEAQ